MLRYAISDRTLFPGEEHVRRTRVIQQAAILAREGVDYFQLREKDLDDEALLELTVAVRDAVHATSTPMRIVLNGPARVAALADVGWHRSSSQSLAECVSTSVHTLDEIELLRGVASLLLFAPVFGKTVAGFPVKAGVGLQRLREAVELANGTPVLALGGITLLNAPLCIAEGAAGIAGIRLFLR